MKYIDDANEINEEVYGYKIDIDRYSEILDAIQENPRKNIIVKGVTGSGKTNIPKLLITNDILTFINEKNAYPRMIYNQPTQSLINTKYIEMEKLINFINKEYGTKFKTWYVYSLRPKRIFYDIILSTYDFSIAYYLGLYEKFIRKFQILNPFGWHVYDEIHVFDNIALTKIAIVQMFYHRNILMTATLHPDIEQHLEQLLKTSTYELKPFRNRKVSMEDPIEMNTLEYIRNNIDDILKMDKKVLIITNTVRTAEEIVNLLGLNPFKMRREGITRIDNGKVAMLTSALSIGTREKVEKQIETDDDIKLIIATQVAEIGLNYDPDIVVTEIAPADALIQRLGRIRTRGKAVILYDKEKLESRDNNYDVYNKEHVKRVLETLDNYNINEILNNIETSQEFIKDSYGATRLNEMLILDIKRLIGNKGILGLSDVTKNKFATLRDSKYVYLLDWQSWVQEKDRYRIKVIKRHLYKASYEIERNYITKKSILLKELINELREDKNVYYTTIDKLFKKNFDNNLGKGNIYALLHQNINNVVIVMNYDNEDIL